MNIKDHRWFTSAAGTVGIVVIDDKWDGIKYYISAVDGNNETADIKYIAEYGAVFPKPAGDILFEI
jgi:hypothetical protein